MPEGKSGAGTKVVAFTEIRNGICEKCHIPMDIIDDVYHCPGCGGKKGELLVAFDSASVDNHVDSEYQEERIKYCMRHRRDAVPEYLRTGGKLPFLKGKKGEAERLRGLNLREV